MVENGQLVMRPWPFLMPDDMARSPDTQVSAMTAAGFRHLLGSGSQEYWHHLESLKLARRPGNASVNIFGLILYGDEVQIFRESWMVLTWMSDNSSHLADSGSSRLLITVFPQGKYLVNPDDKRNMTLQAALKHIADRIVALHSAGLATFVGLKGDWKFLKQSLALRFSYGSLQCCHLCSATKPHGEVPYTDCTPNAEWRTRPPPGPVWHHPPSIASLPTFSLKAVHQDIMHCWHLGLAQDLVAGIVLSCVHRRGIVPGNTIDDRLAYCTRSAKAYARQRRSSLPFKWELSPEKLNMKGGFYVEYRGKAADASVLVPWLEDFLEHLRGVPADLKTLVWLANRTVGLMMSRRADYFLSAEDAQQIQRTGNLWCQLYVKCNFRSKTTLRTNYGTRGQNYTSFATWSTYVATPACLLPGTGRGWTRTPTKRSCGSHAPPTGPPQLKTHLSASWPKLWPSLHQRGS